MSAPSQTVALTRVQQLYAVKSWRYLRLAMVALVLGLGVAVVYEVWKVDWSCTQTSISAYYYTPVRAYFVSALVAVGVCLYCLKGSTELEDVVLNLAGMLAPIVALVPTPERTSEQASCSSFPATALGRDENVANNMTALIVVVVLALVTIAVLTVRRRPEDPPAGGVAVAGYGVAAAVWVVTMFVFWADRPLFLDNAHYVAASLMFGCIVLVVWVNAVGYRDKKGAAHALNHYTLIGAAMIVALVVCGGVGWLGSWDHWLLVLEAVLIGLFAAFWLIQTCELWDEGLRERDPDAQGLGLT